MAYDSLVSQEKPIRLIYEPFGATCSKGMSSQFACQVMGDIKSIIWTLCV